MPSRSNLLMRLRAIRLRAVNGRGSSSIRECSTEPKSLSITSDGFIQPLQDRRTGFTWSIFQMNFSDISHVSPCMKGLVQRLLCRQNKALCMFLQRDWGGIRCQPEKILFFKFAGIIPNCIFTGLNLN